MFVLFFKYISSFIGVPVLGAALFFSFKAIRNIVVTATRNLERECLDIQLKALKQFEPDVVIGILFKFLLNY
jgi:hypothetical protein